MNFRFLLNIIFFNAIVVFALIIPNGCIHEPLDVLKEPDTIKKDTVIVVPPILLDSSGIKCDTNIVYFEKDVMPIIRQSCAITGCHAGGTYEDGVNLENYAKIISTGKVKANNLNTDFYKVITTTKESDVMPPPPNTKLAKSQIDIIAKWINQGAKNLTCNPNYGLPLGCKKENTTYNNFVKKVVQDQCIGCHKSTNASGGINLEGYDNVKKNVDSGKFFGSITWNYAYVKMPLNSGKLDSCTINKIKFWIDNGAKND
jgi:hypothetical protein